MSIVYCGGDYTAEQLLECQSKAIAARLADLDLEQRALKACGYRVHEKERNGTRWLMAAKGLQVQYKHWHPLTSIHQAMQLMLDAPGVNLILTTIDDSVTCSDPLGQHFTIKPTARNGYDVIAAQCRAIVTACASLEPVR